jgi:leucyl aminopeptidase
VIPTLRTSQSSPRDAEGDAIVIGITQDSRGVRIAPGGEDVDTAFGGTLASMLGVLGATGKAEEVTKVPAAAKLEARVVAAAGLGPSGQPDAEALRRAAGIAVRSLAAAGSGTGPRRIVLALPARDAAEAEAVVLGALLGGYVFTRYRTAPQPAPLELTLLTASPQASAAADRARVIGTAMTLVRDLVNTSPADLFPESMAAEAERIASSAGLDIEVLDEKALADGGYGGLVAVGQGSVHPPRLVRLAYRHPGASRTVAFAGKGITFDSGGLSLKPAKSMEHMKSDMAGAAAVLAALQAVAALRPEVNVIGYLPLAENMPGGAAQRPSDVITIYGGKTVEVLNTDAEGRLVLADALARAREDSPDLLVDVATLTGAQVVALGPRISGVMANSDATRDLVVAAARRAGEPVWPMPLPEELRKGLDSMVADIANVPPDRDGGMLVGGLFLRDFVPEGTPWAHLDIAGPAFNPGEPHGYTGKGGTGAAVRVLVRLALDAAGVAGQPPGPAHPGET